jgi:hypothetical protein
VVVDDLSHALKAQADGIRDGPDRHAGTVSLPDGARPLFHDPVERGLRLRMLGGDLHQPIAVVFHTESLAS